MKWECNACADTEGQYLPCVYENPLLNSEPESCPISAEEVEWQKIPKGE